MSIRMPILICVSLFTAGAADRVIVHPAQLAGPYGSDTGKLVIVGNQMVFVDDVNPANSFVIPRTDIRGYNVSNGMVTFNMQQPYTLPMRPEYGGCKSWVTLERPLSTAGAVAAVAESEFARRRTAVLETLGTIPVK